MLPMTVCNTFKSDFCAYVLIEYHCDKITRLNLEYVFESQSLKAITLSHHVCSDLSLPV